MMATHYWGQFRLGKAPGAANAAKMNNVRKGPLQTHKAAEQQQQGARVELGGRAPSKARPGDLQGTHITPALK